MAITNALKYKTYAITKQVIMAEHGNKAEPIFRYTVERPKNGGKIGKQIKTLVAAQKLVDDDLAQNSQGGQR